MSFADIENSDILLGIFSFLPQRDVVRESRYVNKLWMEASKLKYGMCVRMTSSVIGVSHSVAYENEWMYRSLRSALDHCKDGAVICLLVTVVSLRYYQDPPTEPVHITNKTVFITTKEREHSWMWSIDTTQESLFEVENGLISFIL